MATRAVVFYVLAFIFTIVLGGTQQAAGVPSETIILAQWGPGLAALALVLLFRRDGHRFSMVERRLAASRYVLAVLVPAGGALVAYLINSLILGAISFGDLEGVPWSLLLWMPFGAIGEELGWRGYLHKRVAGNLSGLASCLIVGVLWAAWHIGSYQNGPLYMAFFVLLMVSYTIVIYSLVADSAFNVLLAAIFHSMINLTNLFSYRFINEDRFIIVNGLVWAAMAAVVLSKKRALFAARRTT
jgi:membrane protease YdiL (CAAX protease family)